MPYDKIKIDLIDRKRMLSSFFFCLYALRMPNERDDNNNNNKFHTCRVLYSMCVFDVSNVQCQISDIDATDISRNIHENCQSRIHNNNV